MSASTNNKRLILILGGKGGTGKTLFCRTLYYFLVESGLDSLGYDADIENPEFYQYHENSENSVIPLNFLNTEKVKNLFTDLKDYQPEVVLIDMPGASGKATREQLDTFGVFNLAESLGYRVTIATVLNNAYNTISSLEAMIEHCQNRVDYVVIKSQIWNQGSLNFDRWEQSAARVSFKTMNGIEIDLPVLEASTFDVIHEQCYSFFEAHQLSFGDIILLQSYLDRSKPELESAGAFLGIKGLSSPRVMSQHMAMSEQSSSSEKPPRRRIAQTTRKPKALAETNTSPAA